MNVERINKSVKIDATEALKKSFPQVFEDNKVNFEKLKALLSSEIIEKEDDRFYFNWAGKNNLFKLIQTPAYGTLKPDKEKSVDFDKTENVPRLKKYLSEVKQGMVSNSLLLNSDVGSTQSAKELLKNILNDNVYETPKPVGLVRRFIELTTDKNSIVLDFFAGSGTTGQAVWDLNKEDGGNRKFILVQLDEEVQDEEIKKEFPTIADICIERLRRVSERYTKEIASASPRNDNPPVSPFDKGGIEGGFDFGFKVFKLAQSNFNLKDEFEIQEGEDVEELKKKYLEWLKMWVNEPLVGRWKKIDVVYETLLKEGLNLNSKIKEVKIKDNKFYYVQDKGQNLDFYICLEGKIDKRTVEEIRTRKYKDKAFVFLDKALTDNDKINLSVFVRLKVI